MHEVLRLGLTSSGHGLRTARGSDSSSLGLGPTDAPPPPEGRRGPGPRATGPGLRTEWFSGVSAHGRVGTGETPLPPSVSRSSTSPRDPAVTRDVLGFAPVNSRFSFPLISLTLCGL